MRTTQSRCMVRRALLTAALLGALLLLSSRAGGPARVQAGDGSASQPVFFGSEAVFALPGTALIDLDIETQCPPVSPQVGAGSASCVAGVLHAHGANPEAITFYLLTGHILTSFQTGGQPVSPGSATYNLWCCTADSSDMEPVLLNGVPAIVYPLEETANLPLSQYAGYDTVAAQYPNISNGGLDRTRLDQITISPEQGQRFIYDIALLNGCRACGTGYVAQAALDFGPDGTYYGVVPLGIVCNASSSGSGSALPNSCMDPS